MSERLVGYAVLRSVEPPFETPAYCVVRIGVSTGEPGSHHEIIGRHGSIGIARYWACMLNEGKYSEEQAQEGLRTGMVG